MKKSLLAMAGITGLGLSKLAYDTYRDRAVYKGKIRENEIIAAKIDWRDSHHLRFCEESELQKRVLNYKTSVNMRDIGGYESEDGKQIKWGKIYRGEELNHLSKEDFNKFCELGITHIFDLRNTEEAKKHRGPIPPGCKYTNIPVLDELKQDCISIEYPNFVDQFMRDIYTELIKKRGNMFAEVLKALRDDPNAVIYVHCTNGKDRTGIMIAMIMLMLGIDNKQVISDYSLSNLEVNKAFREFDDELVKELGKRSGRLLYGTIGVDPDWINILLRYVNEEYEGIDDFLLKNSDLTKDDLSIIRKNILE